jgi:hypothetical protein
MMYGTGKVQSHSHICSMEGQVTNSPHDVELSYVEVKDDSCGNNGTL